MKTASVQLQNQIKNDIALRAIPKLIAEWNQNRYAGIQEVKNLYGDEASYRSAPEIECFPLESLVEPNRPARGIVKGFAVPENPGSPASMLPQAEPSYPYRVPDARWYTVGPQAAYKYWVSKFVSGATAGAQSDYEFSPATQIQPYVLYDGLTWVNKIVVGFENSWAGPTRFTISTTTNGTTWTTVATDPALNAQGQAVIYLQSNNSWGSTVYRSSGIQIKGIKVQVFAMNRPSHPASIIEISGRLEHDLSDFVIDWDVEFSMDEPNFITPLGKCSSNEGSVTLSNVDGRFNIENENSPYYGIVDDNILFTGSLVYDLTGGGTEEVRAFTMYTSEWSGEGEAEVSVSVSDFAKFFQEQPAPKTLIEEVSVGEAVWRVCDSIGFNNYDYSPTAMAINTQIPYFWTDGEKTVWETFTELAEATQTAIFFDEYGVLNIKTRDQAFATGQTPVWNFAATADQGKLPDVIEAEVVRTYEANSVDITYKATKISKFANGMPVMEKVWEPEGTFVMRASNLFRSGLTSASNVVRIHPTHAARWPYEGMIQVEGEIMSFKGKRYTYFSKTANAPVSVVINSKEEKDYYDSEEMSRDDMKYTNAFTGELMNVVRGLRGTHATDHVITPANYYTSSHSLTSASGTNRGNNVYLKHYPDKSTITFGPGPISTGFTIHRAKAPYSGAAPDHFGASLRFTGTGGGRGGGLYFWGNANGQGYYLEFINSSLRAKEPTIAASQNEIRIISKRSGRYASLHSTYTDENGAVITMQNGKGIPYNFAHNVFYDIDVVAVKPAGADEDHLHIYINGNWVGTFRAGHVVGDWEQPKTNDFGFWVDRHAQIELKYLYAHTRSLEGYDPQDGLSFTEMIRAGYLSPRYQASLSALWQLPYNRGTWLPTPAGQFFFDEFGALVHEIREMEVTFEKSPVLHSRIYVSNEEQIVVPDYEADPFSARFVLMNMARQDAIGQGEDSSTFGSEGSVEQKMMVYGRLVFQEDEETVTVKNEDSVRARGKVDIQINNPWIQNEAEAKSLGEWITSRWPGPAEEIEAEVFGNPLIQLGDYVSLHFPSKDIYANTHRYFVVRITNAFEEGPGTQVTLRRA